MKHIILIFFIINMLIVSLNIRNLYAGWIKTQNLFYRYLCMSFCGLEVFLLFSFLSGYLVVNIIPIDSVLYTCFDSIAIIGISILVVNSLLTALLARKENRGVKDFESGMILPVICFFTMIFILSKFSHHIFGRHYSLFFWLKNSIGLSFLCILFVSGLVLIANKRGVTSLFYKLMSIYLMTTPVMCVIDAYFIRFKLYRAEVSLSMAYPLSAVSIFLFGLFFNFYMVNLLRFNDDYKIRILKFCTKFRLSNREQEVLVLLGGGLSNKKIAEELFISISTVKHHVHSILHKTSCQGRYELISALKSKN